MSENNQNLFLTRLPKKTFEVIAIIPWSDIEKAQKQALAKVGEKMEIKGFRKGKAPENLVAQNLSSDKILELTLQEILPNLYTEAISTFGLKPIMSPKIELVSSKEKEDWKVKFTSCEEPEVNLGNYKDELRKHKASDSIWTPGKQLDLNNQSQSNEALSEKREEKIDKIIKYLLESIKIEISDLFIEIEIKRKLAELLEQAQQLDITIDQYLASLGKTLDDLKQEYRSQVERNFSLQLILEAIAEAEKITVSPEEIEKAIASAKNEEEKKALESQKYLLASIIRQQKTIDFLANL